MVGHPLAELLAKHRPPKATSSTEPKVRRSVEALRRPRKCWLWIRLKRVASLGEPDGQRVARSVRRRRGRLERAQALRQRLSTLLVDEPAVKPGPVQLIAPGPLAL